MIRTLVALLLLCPAVAAIAQDVQAAQSRQATKSREENSLTSDVRRERDALSSTCGSLKGVPGCAQILFTDHPFHIAVGSIAPQNGVAAGGAFTHEQDTKSTRLKWNADAVASSSAAWRAGGYLKIIPTPSKPDIGVTTNPNAKPSLAIHPYPIFNLYVQGISLPAITYFGIGTNTLLSNRSYFGMTQTIVGANAIVPISNRIISSRIGLSIFGEMNGRFVQIRGNHSKSSPSIEQLYTPATAPGLDQQPGFLQLTEGLRVKHLFTPFRTRIDYSAALQEFIAPGSAFTFRRFTLDFGHEFAIYKQQQMRVQNVNQGPDDCRDRLDQPCPKASFTRNREGAITARFLLTESIASAGNAVPFYFQPTLGGSDINGQTMLASYQDYRFRAPNLMLAQGAFEHVIWGPFGFVFTAEGGKVTQARGDLGFDQWKYSLSTGFTIRAGALPVFTFQYAWGGNESSHTTALLSPTLLGSQARPSLQ
jgi:hypothetical protein